MIEAGDYADASRSAGQRWQPTWPAGGVRRFGLSIPTAFQIDHILVGPGFVATETATLTIPDTDHLAVISRLLPDTQQINEDA